MIHIYLKEKGQRHHSVQLELKETDLFVCGKSSLYIKSVKFFIKLQDRLLLHMHTMCREERFKAHSPEERSGIPLSAPLGH